jgi:putative addiction module killer protein
LKFAKPRSLLGGLTVCEIFKQGRVYKLELNGLAQGNPGDVQPVGEGVSELRIHYGPGYRVYFQQRTRTLVVLLAGGDKSTQARDIKTALQLARNLSE